MDDTTQQRKILISELVNMEISRFPDKYLGVYLAPGKITSAMIWPIVELIQRSWQLGRADYFHFKIG